MLSSYSIWACYNLIMRSKKFTLPRKKIAAFCKRWSITEFSLFGSVLRADFRPDSDIDVLVSIDPNAHIGLFEIAQMQIELENIFKRQVDLVEKEGLRNPYRRYEILRTAQVIYAA
jgi:predicted nucleotidyltransferase